MMAMIPLLALSVVASMAAPAGPAALAEVAVVQELSQLPADSPAASTVGTEVGGLSVDSAATSRPAATGMPRSAAPPRTMEAYWPVFALFAVSWIGISAFLLMTGRRSARLAEALDGREARP